MLSFRSASFIVLVVALLFRTLSYPAELNTDVLYSSDDNGDARALLVTAHPDDEAMFFAPTLLALAAKDVAVYSLCLSVGNADGLGDVRRREFGESLDALGVPEKRRWVLDDPALQDNFTAIWDADVIARTVLPYVAESAITTILTFDREGVSQHPNHRSIREGIRTLLSSPDFDDLDSPATLAIHPRFFTLVTVPLASKYLGVVASLQARFDLAAIATLDALTNAFARYSGGDNTDNSESGLEAREKTSTKEGMLARSNNAPVIPAFISGWTEYKTAVRAMLRHKSQMVWFRWLYVAFSRYMWVNEWFEVAV
ncbi:LmbE-like protein [Schizophyllum commune H4-8]|uniref:LmbE-like protein n=1 Tax=Schizophyllum commune (strain H4-8 / FGSC 9210) TaxID=578458 RepID=UPI002160010A|nr:LmbE-like protein [Schizophyllum commune H4-8]KAI5888694.1 LmbE-like protein [Schizophyllum commune H4-8]